MLLHLFNTLSWSEIKRSLSITVLFKGYLTFFLYKVHKGDGSSQAKRPCGPSAFCVLQGVNEFVNGCENFVNGRENFESCRAVFLNVRRGLGHVLFACLFGRIICRGRFFVVPLQQPFRHNDSRYENEHRKNGRWRL